MLPGRSIFGEFTSSAERALCGVCADCLHISILHKSHSLTAKLKFLFPGCGFLEFQCKRRKDHMNGLFFSVPFFKTANPVGLNSV